MNKYDADGDDGQAITRLGCNSSNSVITVLLVGVHVAGQLSHWMEWSGAVILVWYGIMKLSYWD